MKKLISVILFIFAIPLWIVGQLGTIGGIQFIDKSYMEYASFHPLFLIPWAMSIVLTWAAMEIWIDSCISDE